MLDAIKGKLAALRAAPAPVNELLETVDDLREQVATLQQEREATLAAPRPVEEVSSLLDDRLSALAADALDALHVPSLLTPGADVTVKLSATGDARTEVGNLLGLLVLLHRPALKKVMTAQIEQAASLSPVPPLSEGQRAARLSELDGQILAAEMAEEACIRRLEAVGIAVQRRSDLNPLVALAADDALPS
jgi:hypothetical protein